MLTDQVAVNLSVSSEDSRVCRAEERREGKIQYAGLSLTFCVPFFKCLLPAVTGALLRLKIPAAEQCFPFGHMGQHYPSHPLKVKWFMRTWYALYNSEI